MQSKLKNHFSFWLIDESDGIPHGLLWEEQVEKTELDDTYAAAT
jgi:hypothetical protein